MIRIRVMKFSSKEWLIIKVDNTGGRFHAEIADIFKTQKEALSKKGLIEYILKKSKKQLEILKKEIERQR